MRYGFVSFPAARMGWEGLADKREAAIRRSCGVSADDAGASFALRSARGPGAGMKRGGRSHPPRVPPLPQSMLRST